jgi:hypothetical protein
LQPESNDSNIILYINKLIKNLGYIKIQRNIILKFHREPLSCVCRL